MSSSKQTRRHRDGRWLADIVADGEQISVPLHLCDTARRDLVLGFGALAAADAASLHRPGFRRSADSADLATRDAARSRWLADMNSAWRMDAKRRADPDEDDDEDDEANLRHESPSTDVRAPARKARDAYRRWLDDESGLDVRAPAIRARDRWVRSLQDAWRTPSRDAVEAGPGPAATMPAPRAGPAPKRPVPDTREQQYAQRCADLENAWRGPGPGAPGASLAVTGPGAAYGGR
jgi:hypothetical protein